MKKINRVTCEWCGRSLVFGKSYKIPRYDSILRIREFSSVCSKCKGGEFNGQTRWVLLEEAKRSSC